VPEVAPPGNGFFAGKITTPVGNDVNATFERENDVPSLSLPTDPSSVIVPSPLLPPTIGEGAITNRTIAGGLTARTADLEEEPRLAVIVTFVL
jgi:hypothetical protein